MLHIVNVLSFLVLSVSLVQAKYRIHSSDISRDAAQQAVAYKVELPLDHFGSNTDTFLNRYWVSDEFYKDGGPVIIYDAGETNASEFLSILSFGQHGTDAIADYARRFSALLILWEHRYYGESLPNPNTALQSVDDYANFYQYLTIEQALEDVVVFAKNFSLPIHPSKDFRPNNTPWVFIGGSYPGVRSAYMRLRNPEVIYASLASSAPVQMQEDFWEYYVAIERKLAATPGYEGCLQDSIAFSQWATSVVEQKNVSAAEAFLSVAALNHNASQENTSDAWWTRETEFWEVFHAPIMTFQDFGLNGGTYAAYCNALVSPKYTQDNSATSLNLKDGIVAYYGLDNSLTIFATVIHAILEAEQQTGTDTGSAPDSLSNFNNLSWNWQTCTEMGFFQVSNTTRSTNILPGFIDINWWIQFMCVSNFGQTTARDTDTDKINTKYHGWRPLNATNIFFVNSQYDPWRALSVASDIDASSPNNAFTTDIPASGQTPANGAYFGYLVQDGIHCSDLIYNMTAVATNTTTEDSYDVSAAEAHEIFASALSTWLPAFTPFAAPAVSATQKSIPSATATAAHSGAAHGGRVCKRSALALVVMGLAMAMFG